jgi:signal transduction histidine kinase/ActR/RegA family two-component response regulator
MMHEAEKKKDANRRVEDMRALALYDGGSHAVLVLDSTLFVRYCNAAFRFLVDFEVKHLIGHSAHDIMPYLSSLYMQTRFEQLFEYGASFSVSPFVHDALLPSTLPNGEERLCRLDVTPLEYQGTTYALCMFEDISCGWRLCRGLTERCQRVETELNERVSVERQIATERMNLEKIIEERTRELRSSLRQQELTNMRLEQANKHKSRFLSSMSHELRTPLNAVLGFNDLLKGQFFGELNEKQLSYVDQIDASSKHLLALISDLLDIAKIDAGTMDLDCEDIPVEEFIYASQTMMNPQFKEKNLDVETYVDPELTTIQADRRKWKQIMLNLLSNAVKYTPEDGQISINVTKRDSESILIEVHDTGIGIHEEDIQKVFTDFYQTERVRDQQLGGTGIGLALTKRMVELHKGEIGAESEPGKGSMFWFSLPISQHIETVPRPADETSASLATPGSGRSRILVVEDDSTNLEMVLDMLSIQGHDAHGAGNGREALQLAETFHPDLIFMDIRMPVMDGFEATRELRKMPEFRETPIVALTANTSSHAENDCLEAGCTAYVPKPIRSARLFEILDQFLPAERNSDE